MGEHMERIIGAWLPVALISAIVGAIAIFVLKLDPELCVIAAAGTFLVAGVVRLKWGWIVDQIDDQEPKFDVPDPPKKRVDPNSIRFWIVHHGQQHDVTLEVRRDKLVILVRSILNGKDFTERAWCEGSHTLFGRKEFRKIRAEFERAGIIEKIDAKKNSSYRVTDVGYEVLTQLLKYLSPTYPEKI